MRKISVVIFCVLIVVLLILHLRNEPVKLQISCDKKIYEGEKLSVSDINAELFRRDGSTAKGDIGIQIKEERGHFLVSASFLNLFSELYDEITVEPIHVKDVRAEYTHIVKKGSAPEDKYVDASITYEDGKTEKVEAQILDKSPLSKNEKRIVWTKYGEASIFLPAEQPTGIKAEYTLPVLEGDTPVKEGFSVKIVYESGAEEDTDFEVELSPVNEETEFTVQKDEFTTTVNIIPSKIISTHIIGNISHRTGERPGIEGVSFVYDNGTTVDVDRTELNFKENLADKLVSGENIYHCTYRGKDYEIKINAAEKTLVDEASEQFAEEYRLADYRYKSENIFVTVEKHKVGEAFYFLSHIVVNDPQQLRSGLSYGDYGGERELPTDAAKRLNWVIGTNGSNFNYGTGTPEYAGVCIKDRQVMEGTQTNGMEICLMSNGVLFSPDPGVEPQKLIESGVTDSWSCGDTLLINDGFAVNVGIQSEQYRYPRTAVGMVQPCEYYLITAGSGNYKGGMTYDEVRSVLMSHGCSFGKCMDGGGSSSLVFRGELLNTPAVGNMERAVVDFLYFVE